MNRPPGLARARILRLRRGVGQTRAGRTLKRALGREIRIPVARAPDPSALIAYPGEDDLPEEIRDVRLLMDALAWRPRTLESPGRGERLTQPPPEPLAAFSSEAAELVNIVFVSHCDFTGNSALHVYAIACEVHRRGRSPLIAVPDHAESVDDVGRPPFPVLTFAEVLAGDLRFPNGRGPDLVYAFTPRELVRELTVELVRKHGCRYIVHLEDDDEVVLSAELGGVDVAALRRLPLPELDRIIRPRQAHPLRAARFLEQAAGVTVLLVRLLELVPPGPPAAVVRAGFDEAVLAPRRPRDEVRADLGLETHDFVIGYTGNIHSVNVEEMRSLYAAVAQLRRDGQRVVLVKTGWGSPVAAAFGFPALGAGLRDLGWVPRGSVPEILAAADALVQPGGPGPFNDFRFPSKLPEYLASGRPVVLPRTNVGLELRDGQEALLLERGDATEIAAAITRLAADPALRAVLGEGGRAFAMRELRWSASVDRLDELLHEIEARRTRPAPAWALDGADPPVKLVAVVPAAPLGTDARVLREHGIYGFCLDRGAPLEIERDSGMAVRNGLVEPSAVEDPLISAQLSTDVMWERLAAPIPNRPWFRSLAAPRGPAAASIYEVWLRKLVLQTALRAPGQEPFVFLDVSTVWDVPPQREAWLTATRSAMREGIRQFYSCQHLTVSSDEADLILRMT